MELNVFKKYCIQGIFKFLTVSNFTNASLAYFNPIQTGLFLVFWDRGGGGLIRPPPLNSENIKAMTTKLGKQIIRQKMFPLRSATQADGVM